MCYIKQPFVPLTKRIRILNSETADGATDRHPVHRIGGPWALSFERRVRSWLRMNAGGAPNTWESCAMGGTLTQRRRVRDEGPRVVNRFQQGRGRKVTVPAEEAPAKYVPAAAVIRMGRALSGFIGRKARVGGLVGRESNPGAQPPPAPGTTGLESGRGGWNSQCSGGMRRYWEEHRWRRRPSGPRLTLRRESWGSEQD